MIKIYSIFRLSFLLMVYVMLAQAQPAQAQVTFQSAYADGIEARDGGRLGEYLQNIQVADSLRPNHRVILLELAKAYTANGKMQEAVAALSYRADFYAEPDFKKEAFWLELEENTGQMGLLEKLKKLNEPVENSALAFELEQAGFHAEGIAYEENEGRFYLSDVRCGEIISLKPSGEDIRREFDLKEWGFWGAMGMAVDTEHNILWVASSALPNFCDYEESMEGRSAVLKIDLNSKKLLESYQTAGEHVFGDLILAPDGEIWVSDSREPVIYKVEEDSGTLTPLLQDERFWNLQGLAVMDHYLYVSDYISGLYAMHLRTGEVSEVSEENQRLRGADGLYARNGKLYMLQNGTRPFRISSVEVDADGKEVMHSYKILEQAGEYLGEPTLGAWMGEDLYFIANSPWAYYDDEGRPLLDDWPRLQIRVLKAGS